MVNPIGKRTLILGNLAIALSKAVLGIIGLSGSEVLGPQTVGLMVVYTAYIFVGIVNPISLWGYANNRFWSLGALFMISIMALTIDIIVALYNPVMLIVAIVPATTIWYIVKNHSTNGSDRL